MGFENEAEQSLGRPCCRVTAGPSRHAISPHPSSREGHHSTARWSSRFLLSIVILRCHAAAASCRLQRNSVSSTQIRCMITASRRTSATIAFLIPRRLAICIAQALSQEPAPPQPPWSCESAPAHRWWRGRSAPPPDRHWGSSSGAGKPHRHGQ
jgi:hypothetical protein